MKLGRNCGHTLRGAGIGADGCGKREQDLTREVGAWVDTYMKKYGHTIVNCTVDSANSSSSALNLIVQKANSQSLDLFLSIHFNASNGQGNGTECWIYSYNDITKAIGDRICSNFANMGFKNRGVKLSKNAPSGGLAVVDNTKAPAILVECCFIDNQSDMSKYDAKKFGKAIVEGILNISINEPQDTPTAPPSSNTTTYYRVVTNSYTIRSYAEKEMNDLKKLGYSAFLDAFKKNNKSYLRVVAGSYTNRSNADKLMIELKNKGYNPFMAIYKK